MSEVDIFKSYLLTKGLRLNPPATPKDIDLFELFWEIRLPEDLKEYFLKINGFPRDEQDCLTYLWSLWDVDKLNERWVESVLEGLIDGEHYYVFADYDAQGFDWAIRLTEDDNHPIFITAGSYLRKVANNFTDFIERYRKEEPESLLTD